MNLSQTTEILDYLSAIDGRVVTAEKVKAWHDVIGFMEFDLAKESAVLAHRQENISYVEPKHIIAMSHKVKENARTDESRKRALEGTPTVKGSPMPKCIHGIGLLLCDACCRLAAQNAGLIK